MSSLAGVRSLSMGAIKARKREEAVEYADSQRCTYRCTCGWYMRNVLVGDGKRAFKQHLEGARHTRKNQKQGRQAKSADRANGMSWA